MKTQVPKAEIKLIMRQLIEKYKPEKIILFGSAAKGNFRTDSDLDFMIVKQTTKNKAERMREVSSLVSRKTPADFLVYTPEEIKRRLAIGDYFVEDVLKEGKVLYEG